MADIKVKEIKDKTIKSLNKTKVWTERVKEPIVLLNNKSKEQLEENNTTSEYGEDKIKYYSNRMKDETIYQSKKIRNKATNKLKEEYQKRKFLRSTKEKINQKAVENSYSKIKNTKSVMKNTEKLTKETTKTSKKMFEQGKKLFTKTAKETVRTTKAAVKMTISTVKAIIASVKSLSAVLMAGGTVATIVVIVICLVALLLSSCFGIFFANEGKSRTMTSVISQINAEVYQKAENQRFNETADDIIVQTTYSNWKEVIAVYSVKYSNDDSKDSSIAMYLNEKNISKLRKVFYDFNTIKIETKTEEVEETTENEDNKEIDLDSPIQSTIQTNKTQTKTKKIIYVNVESKTLDQIMKQYNFSENQKKETKEILDKQYNQLWLSLLYGNNAGEFVLWRQSNALWSNILIGNSGKNIGNIGCLVTSISILIEKSGVNTTIIPFNPGTFVEALNNNGGFDEKGNLQYMAINKVIPNFKYVDRVILKDKTQNEKLKLIKEYQDKGYYLAVEVKGSTGQHWVAVMNVDNTITMADPASDATSLWSTYNWKNTSQFVYFKKK